MIVVIPTNRSINLKYLRPLVEAHARFIVVYDGESGPPPPLPGFQVFDWDARRRVLGSHDEWFPRRSGACRDLGLLLAWREAAPGETVVALDDDCEVPAGFASEVERTLSSQVRPILGVEGRHLNVLDLYDRIPRGLFPRGFPYSARADYAQATSSAETSDAPVFNVGLWQDAFDVNAIDKFSGAEWRFPEAKLRRKSVILARGNLVSVCSMNMQMRREVIPGIFQFPMYVEVIDHFVIDRYGDIWGGFLFKLLADRKGDPIAAGGPMIAHRKAGDARRNAWQEHLAHLVNDELIALLVESAADVRAGTYLEMMEEVAAELARRADGCSVLLRRYCGFLAASMTHFTAALRES